MLNFNSRKRTIIKLEQTQFLNLKDNALLLKERVIQINNKIKLSSLSRGQCNIHHYLISFKLLIIQYKILSLINKMLYKKALIICRLIKKANLLD